MRKLELAGQRFGKLVVVEEVENKGKNIVWLCRCDCGKEKIILGYNLTSGKSQSCGCVRGEKLRKFSTTHGDSKTRLYRIYKGMKQRCYNENTPTYKRYGARGIIICNEWLDDFSTFKKWALGNGYNDTLSIDRINPNGNYCPENCRWISMKKQQNNKLNNAFVIIGDDKRTIAEWADRNKTNKQTLYSKFYRLLEQLNINANEVAEINISLKDK